MPGLLSKESENGEEIIEGNKIIIGNDFSSIMEITAKSAIVMEDNAKSGATKPDDGNSEDCEQCCVIFFPDLPPKQLQYMDEAFGCLTVVLAIIVIILMFSISYIM